VVTAYAVYWFHAALHFISLTSGESHF